MARRALTQLERFRAAQPAEEPFDLPMVADSTTEVAVDISTGIDSGEGWAILGFEWAFRLIASPFAMQIPNISATDITWQLQLCRGEAPETPVLLDPHDDDLIGEDCFMVDNAAAPAGQVLQWPRYKPLSEVTIQDSCYFVFGTDADDTAISQTTIAIMGILFYEQLEAPNLGQGKGGYLGNL